MTRKEYIQTIYHLIDQPNAKFLNALKLSEARQLTEALMKTELGKATCPLII